VGVLWGLLCRIARVFRRPGAPGRGVEDGAVGPPRRWLNVDLAMLALLVLVLDQFYAGVRVLPTQETAQAFQGFHYFYNQFFHTGEIPRWTPYGTFGAPTGFWQLLLLTPANYVCMIVGRWLGTENVLGLFKLSLLMEQFILLVGLYKLARLLYASRLAVFMVCAGTLGTVVWCCQVWSYLRVYYLLPLMLFFLLRFFERGRGWYFWLTGATVVVSLMGNPPFYALLWLVVLGVTAGVLTLRERSAWRSLVRPSAGNLFTFSGFLLLAAAWGGVLAYSLARMRVGPQSLDEFVARLPGVATTARHKGWCLHHLFRMFVFSWPVHVYWSKTLENTVYLGLLPLPLGIYAVGRVRDARFWALGASALVLLWIAAHHAPSDGSSTEAGFSALADVGRLTGLARVLILMCAGFGLQELLRRGRPGHVVCMVLAAFFLHDLLKDRFVLAGLEMPMNLAGFGWLKRAVWFITFWTRTSLAGLMAACAVAGVVVLKAISAWRRWCGGSGVAMGPAVRRLAVGVVGFYLLDVVLFQIVVAYTVPQVALAHDPRHVSLKVAPLLFPVQKKDRPLGERSWLAMWLMKAALSPYTPDEMTYGFAQYDARAAYSDLLLWSAGPKRLFQARGHRPKNDPAFARVLGWSGSKFRLMTNTIFVPSAERATEIIRSERTLDRVLILRDGPPGEEVRAGPTAASRKAGEVRLLEGSANRVAVEAEVTADGPTWLVYADAFHPGWRATVNGKETPIAEAYLAFKAVPVEKGKNVVVFRFDCGWGPRMAGVVAWLGVAFCLVMGAEFLVLLMFRPQPTLVPEEGEEKG